MIKRKKLPSKDALESFFYVDSDEGVLIWRFHPVCPSLIGKRVQGNANNKYTKVTVPGYGQFYLHRIIWLYVNGSSPDVLDHINRDKSDNRISNLRECTASENEKNKVSHGSNQHGYTGVTKLPSGRYQARVSIPGSRVSLGTFDTPEHAAGARMAFLILKYPDFARSEIEECMRKGIVPVATKDDHCIPNKRNSSGVTGVRFCRTRGKWIASATRDGLYSYLGSFAEKSGAIAARLRFNESKTVSNSRLIEAEGESSGVKNG